MICSWYVGLWLTMTHNQMCQYRLVHYAFWTLNCSLWSMYRMNFCLCLVEVFHAYCIIHKWQMFSLLKHHDTVKNGTFRVRFHENSELKMGKCFLLCFWKVLCKDGNDHTDLLKWLKMLYCACQASNFCVFRPPKCYRCVNERPKHIKSCLS